MTKHCQQEQRMKHRRGGETLCVAQQTTPLPFLHTIYNSINYSGTFKGYFSSLQLVVQGLHLLHAPTYELKSTHATYHDLHNALRLHQLRSKALPPHHQHSPVTPVFYPLCLLPLTPCARTTLIPCFLYPVIFVSPNPLFPPITFPYCKRSLSPPFVAYL
ncbi:hypothetical protein Pcinc_016603 [Petrolisthes cinctipes]|uniref:Uncharacterized protein n=1 Tax=Petrolisthes cinctipes TaxID=88211 RepID=A0AAE1FT95_PETCI|nr:hypothetical protein Pcinc_016603 [Petrolisthes cinctipes]